MNNTTEIGIALAKLQESLKEIDSAREQVKKIVTAYGQTGEDISNYINELSETHAEIEKLINSEKTNFESAKECVTQISSQCDTVIQTLKTTINSLLKQNRDHINSVQNKYDEHLSANDEKFSTVAKSLIKNSQDLVDTLQTLITNFSSILAELREAMKPIDTTISKIDTLSSDLTKSHNQIITAIQQIAINQDSFDKKNNELIGSLQKNNKIFSIITIILLCIVIALIIIK
ncbi:MAG: hypothetical protein R3Y59_09725 [bacterium]